MPTINSITPNQNYQWISELAETINPEHLHALLLNNIRDISRSFTLTERQKMHRIRNITEAYDTWRREPAPAKIFHVK